MTHPEGHRLRPCPLTPEEAEFLELDPDSAHMFCRNCGEINPEPGEECLSA